jgi:hypothetical protein
LARWYHPLMTMRRQSRASLSARSWPPGYPSDRPSLLKPGGDAEDLRARLTPEAPRRKCHRSQERLQVARRHIDDQPPELALTQRRQFPTVSICQLIRSAPRGLSWRKSRCAKLTKSSRSSVSYVLQVNSPAVIVAFPVTPAHGSGAARGPRTGSGRCLWATWVPAFAGMTSKNYRSSSSQDWHSLAMKVAMTSSSAGAKGAGWDGGATPIC